MSLPKLKRVHNNSVMDKISRLDVADYLYIETTPSDWPTISRTVTAVSRYPSEMLDRRFTTSTYTAVHSVGNVKTLVRIERTT